MNITKKIISLLLVLVFISNTNFIFAENGAKCNIENTPPYITDYIKNLRKVVSNVNKFAIKKRKSQEDSSIWESNNKSYFRVYWSLNTLFTWKWNSLDFEYLIWENTKEIPKEAKRDIAILEKEKDSLNKYYENFAKKDLSVIELEKSEICEGIDDWKIICEKYISQKEKAIDVLLKASRSLNSLISEIKDNITDKDFQTTKNYFLLKDEDIEKIKVDYSKKSLEACNKIESADGSKWFFKTIIDAIKKIDLKWKNYNEKTNDWKEAIDILWWDQEGTKYRNNERKLLEQELQNQGIWWDQADTILWNLDAYNTNWTLLWWKQWFLNSIKDQINEFEETLKIEKSRMVKLWWISAKDFESKVWIVRESEKVKIDINSTYSKLKELSLQDDITNDTLANRMIKMHLNLSEAINRLNKTCKVSIKVCNSQKKWEWDCGKCN